MNKYTAEFVLHAMMAALLAAVIAVAAYGWNAVREAHAQQAGALPVARDLAAASALARGADATAKRQAAAFAEMLQGGAAAGSPEQVAQLRAQQDAIERQLAEASALLARHGLDVRPLSQASGLAAQMVEQYVVRLKQVAGGGIPLPVEGRWRDVAVPVERHAQEEASRLQAAADSRANQVLWVMVGGVVLTLAMAWFFRWWIRRANVGPLRTAIKMVERIAYGDLTASATGMDQLHTRRLGEALNGMAAAWRKIGGDILVSARTVADTSAQIAQGNLDLSQRTEEQASTLEETASSMEELTSTVAHNADNARQASQLAVNASEVARKGGQVVGQVVNTMTDISASSRKIGDIIGVIDGIAFQTNILALNAAVEAARAGEQGRGFAVVAAEVRSLAQRSAAAAKEIKSLIGDSVGKVEAGTKLVDDAGKTMQEIVSSVKKVSDLIAEIAAASSEQSAGIGQVNTAVAQMEQVVQQNASLVEEATAATESMKDQAAYMLTLVAGLKLDDGPAPTEVTPMRPVAPRPAPQQPAAKPRPAATALPPAYATAIAGGGSRPPRGRGGDWEEF
ncbi:hypothetical protein FN976_13770 [Caenimonas sedimenti]|uniref:Methyl-accepting transducer domain-containing protein n=1 Tax=Caenimonas sedimenti TaxID=2596921 RepID=A0A562ZPV8_9BURK|nr:methyl-accepting chemotaxis protein [Caenimonas sedimenti]TWO70622.1 hypothetical protein FN976_13770 [Caenimonas sedimenti]